MRVKKLRVAMSVALAALATMPGCVPKSDCQIAGYHLHKYESDDGLVKYMASENLNDSILHWTDEVLYVNSSEEELRNEEEKHSVYRIADNITYIQQMEEGDPDYYTLYEYSDPIPYTYSLDIDGTTIYYYLDFPNTSWTENPNHSDLTGNTKTMQVKYATFYFEQDKNGRYVLKDGPLVDSLLDYQDMYFSPRSRTDVEVGEKANVHTYTKQN